ncbi:MAG: hypothetical protein M3384_00250 [Acidobacteriota bacterium]|nr:hypothetical protein [Acidobacteriota bacterium]
MRKKCIECGLIGFISDEICKRCGSNKLTAIPNQNASPAQERETFPEPLSIWNYLIYAFLAIIIEIGATSPIWLLIGSHPGGDASGFLQLAFILNLPTVLITWSLDILIGSNFNRIFFTPITQIIFWVCLFAYFGNRRRTPKK